MNPEALTADSPKSKLDDLDLQSFSSEARSLYIATVTEFYLNLEVQSRACSGTDERILRRHVESARDKVLPAPLGKAVDIATLILVPLGFWFLGLSGDAIIDALRGQDVEAHRFITFAIGTALLGGAITLYAKSALVKRAVSGIASGGKGKSK